MKITKIGGHAKPSYRVAAYCRVSTDKDAQQESFEIQKHYYTELIHSQPFWVMVNIYADEGRSGTGAGHRPQFIRMMTDAKAGMIDIILVKSISRFARNAADCQSYVRELKTCGVEVRFEREGISNMDPSADFVFSMLAVVAQEESRSISENVRWRYKKDFEKGIYHMGSNRLLGYDMGADGRLTPNQDAWIIKKIFEGYAAGMNLKEICDALNAAGARRLRSERPFTPVTVSRILQNENYVGDLHMQKRAPTDYLTKKPVANTEYMTYYVKNEHEGIVSREVWDLVQERIGAAKRDREAGLYRNATRTHCLYGIVFCAECGSPMLRRSFADRNKKRGKAWDCRGRRKRKNGCQNPSIREEELIFGIMSALQAHGVEIDSGDAETIATHTKRVDVSLKEIRISVQNEGKTEIV
ncbi:MAG: recombinase family protein [Clostridiales bacterium]|nr:recombinase family protein [Clostridiales bacterium]